MTREIARWGDKHDPYAVPTDSIRGAFQVLLKRMRREAFRRIHQSVASAHPQVLQLTGLSI